MRSLGPRTSYRLLHFGAHQFTTISSACVTLSDFGRSHLTSKQALFCRSVSKLTHNKSHYHKDRIGLTTAEMEQGAATSRVDRLATLMASSNVSDLASHTPKLSATRDWERSVSTHKSPVSTEGRPKKAYTSSASTRNISDAADNNEIQTIESHQSPSPIVETPTNTAKRFYPLMPLSKLPYKFLPTTDVKSRQRIAEHFFDGGKFWNTRWDLYYIHSELVTTQGPVYFVTEKNVQRLFANIQAMFPKESIEFPTAGQFEGLMVDFPFDNPDFCPSWLGESHSRQDFDHWKEKIAGPPAQPSHTPSDTDLEKFRTTVLAAKHALNPNKPEQDRARSLHAAKSLADVKRLLGLAKETESALTPVEAAESDEPTFDQDAVFICCDIESFEFDHNRITEIGFATLDTRDLRGTAPGRFAQDWYGKIRGRHFRIKECLHLENRKYVKGCSKDFLFGQSEIVSIRNAPRAVAECFRPPFSRVDYDDSPYGGVALGRRNIVLVGHDTKNDIGYLRKIGYDVGNLGSLIQIVDTAQLWRAYAQTPDQPALAKICAAMDIETWSLHNAGNDAMYTLQAMLGICVCSAEGKSAGVH